MTESRRIYSSSSAATEAAISLTTPGALRRPCDGSTARDKRPSREPLSHRDDVDQFLKTRAQLLLYDGCGVAHLDK
jgi:hypothetical protein